MDEMAWFAGFWDKLLPRSRFSLPALPLQEMLVGASPPYTLIVTRAISCAALKIDPIT